MRSFNLHNHLLRQAGQTMADIVFVWQVTLRPLQITKTSQNLVLPQYDLDAFPTQAEVKGFS